MDLFSWLDRSGVGGASGESNADRASVRARRISLEAAEQRSDCESHQTTDWRRNVHSANSESMKARHGAALMLLVLAISMAGCGSSNNSPPCSTASGDKACGGHGGGHRGGVGAELPDSPYAPRLWMSESPRRSHLWVGVWSEKAGHAVRSSWLRLLEPNSASVVRRSLLPYRGLAHKPLDRYSSIYQGSPSQSVPLVTLYSGWLDSTKRASRIADPTPTSNGRVNQPMYFQRTNF